MKKMLMAMAVMTAMAMAQTGSTSSGSADTAKSSKGSEKSSSEAKAGKEKTITGCLHKDGENMWLATKTSKYHVMSSQDLSAHDGHEVKVTGTASKAPMPGSEDKKNINHLEASNVEMVSETCKMGTHAMKMKGDELSKQGEETKKK